MLFKSTQHSSTLIEKVRRRLLAFAGPLFPYLLRHCLPFYFTSGRGLCLIRGEAKPSNQRRSTSPTSLIWAAPMIWKKHLLGWSRRPFCINCSDACASIPPRRGKATFYRTSTAFSPDLQEAVLLYCTRVGGRVEQWTTSQTELSMTMQGLQTFLH